MCVSNISNYKVIILYLMYYKKVDRFVGEVLNGFIKDNFKLWVC